MKVELKQLAALLSRLEDEPVIPRDGVNSYLLDKVLVPGMNGDTLCLGEIDFDAFDLEDVNTLANYYDELQQQSCVLSQWAKAMVEVLPAASRSRAFC